MCSIRRRPWKCSQKTTDLTQKIRAVFKCISQTAIKLTIEKCNFGVRQVEFLGRTIAPEGISPQANKIHNSLDKLRFRGKFVKPQSMATAKHNFQRLVFNPANQKLIDFLDELQKLAKDASGVAAQAIIEQFIYAKMPPHLKKSINQAHLENGTYEQIVSHLERELELNGLEAPDEMPINTVTQQAPQQNSNKPRPTCHHCKIPDQYQNQCRQLKREKDQTRNNTNSATKNNGSAQTNSNPNNNKVANNNKGNKIINQRDRRSRPTFPPCETCGRKNHSTEKCYLGANAANRPPPRNRRPARQNQGQQNKAQSNSDGNVQAAAQALN